MYFRFLILSINGSLEFCNSGVLITLIVLETHFNAFILLTNVSKFLIIFSFTISFVEYVIIKNSSDPYVSFNSLKYFKSGSFSKSKLCAEASRSKFLEKYTEVTNKLKKNIRINFGYCKIFLK